MPIAIGDAAEHGFANPIGLLTDCHRRIERFLKTLEAVVGEGGVLDAQCRKALQTALEYFRSAALKQYEFWVGSWLGGFTGPGWRRR